MTEHNQPEECEIGENLAADISLIGCYLMQEGVVREKKEKIKEYVAQVVTAHLKNQKHSLLSTLKSEVEGMKVCRDCKGKTYTECGVSECSDGGKHGCSLCMGSGEVDGYVLQQVIDLIEKYQNEG